LKTFTDIDLVERLKKGDVLAFDLIYGRYSGKLYSFGFKYLRTSDDAKELVQSVFLKLWENHKNLVKESSLKSYLFTIAYNDICKFFRKKYYLQKFICDNLDKNSEATVRQQEGIEYQSVFNQVQKLIERLPERQKIVFKKSKLEGKPSKEIAEELQLSPGTVDNYISEAVKFIRHRMCKEDLAFILFIWLFIS